MKMETEQLAIYLELLAAQIRKGDIEYITGGLKFSKPKDGKTKLLSNLEFVANKFTHEELE